MNARIAHVWMGEPVTTSQAAMSANASVDTMAKTVRKVSCFKYREMNGWSQQQQQQQQQQQALFAWPYIITVLQKHTIILIENERKCSQCSSKQSVKIEQIYHLNILALSFKPLAWGLTDATTNLVTQMGLWSSIIFMFEYLCLGILIYGMLQYVTNYCFVHLISPDVDECKNGPCKNGGNCTNLMGSYRCDCVNGFTGKHCDQG